MRALPQPVRSQYETNVLEKNESLAHVVIEERNAF